MDILSLTAVELAKAIRKGKTTSVEATQAVLDKIAASELLRVSPEIVETVGREAVDFGTVPSVVYEGKTYLYLPIFTKRRRNRHTACII